MNKIRNEQFIKAFGKHLRKIRISKGLTMEALAMDVDIEYRHLGRIERGEVNTSISHVAALAKGLKVKPYELLNF